RSNADATTHERAARYANTLNGLATPYAISIAGVATQSVYGAKTLGAANGLVSTVFDFAKVDLALKQGLLLHDDTLAAAWQNPVNANGQTLPHGMGWFVQTYNGEPVVWQFGIGPAASSA